MRLPAGGIDIFYIDESLDSDHMTMSAIAIPFLRRVAGTWSLVWEDQLANIREWRRHSAKKYGLHVPKELKGSKLLSGRGRFYQGKHQLPRTYAQVVYRGLLNSTHFLPAMSIITAVGGKATKLYGHGRLQALLYAVLQRMRTACARTNRAGMVFFDEGHDEYRKLYRKARVFLPTGSAQGAWNGGDPSKNLPLNNFTKDGNTKDSRHSLFIQLADLVSYAALLKVRGENDKLTPWQRNINAASLYDAIPTRVLNTAAHRQDTQGIVRL